MSGENSDELDLFIRKDDAIKCLLCFICFRFYFQSKFRTLFLGNNSSILKCFVSLNLLIVPIKYTI